MTDKSYIRESKPHYRSGVNTLKDDFFDPCLGACSFYYRASGYFSSSALRAWANILPRLVESDSVELKLLISPELSSRDKEALARAFDPNTKQEILAMNISKLIDDMLGNSDTMVDLFAWMIATKRLKLKFAFASHIDTPHIYHEKYGIFGFPWGDELAFIGSANETASGHTYNYESVDVYRSWVGGENERVEQKLAQFNEAWSGEANGLKVCSLSQQSIKLIQTRADHFVSGTTPASVSKLEKSVAVNDKWRHQDEAVLTFSEARAGILEMATGTGKTRVAMRLIEELYSAGKIDSAIICTVGNDLMGQWFSELLSFLPSLGLAIFRHFGKHHELNRYLSHPQNSILIVSRSNLGKALSQLSAKDKNRTFVIHDEVHGFGSPSNIRDLSGKHEGVVYRLGLSATPDREYDVEGTEFILREIGQVVYTFGLSEAISRGILCEFDYIPLEYSLTDSDRIRLKAVYQRKAIRAREGKPMPDAELYRELSNVYKTAEEKPGIFREYVRSNPEILKGTIVFAHTKDYGIEAAASVHEITEKYSTYFDDDHVDRLEAFGRGELDCLITCHRVSQGIDIRHLKNIILLSSDRAKLETIQRIGRCLRIDPENPSKRAVVLDFIREKEKEKKGNADDLRKAWLEELSTSRRRR